MKTEISRDSHQIRKRYSGVYQQQGRMLTDADWNELVEILKERLTDSLKDVVGNGSPLHRNVVNNDAAPTLQWGYVYVDGVQAAVRPSDDASAGGTFEYAHQHDFPSPPPAPANHVLYADVWERAVTHLMDERLRDKGLHGADTTTRTQTLAQVKWCAAGIDPEHAPTNPPKGNAGLSLRVLHKTTEADPCDPCADQLDVESRVGNYLFRVEVHDVVGAADDPDRITLKWSSENGAEQFEALPTQAEMPAGFISDKWVYEFYDETTERHVGVHLESGAWTPARGVLAEIREPSSPYAVPAIPGSSETKKFVRRWDGYCTLDLTAGTPADMLDAGVDRGVALSTTKAADALGFVGLGASLKINLAAIGLELALAGRKFVAGDYWLADVREAEHDPLDPAKSRLMDNAPPAGIEHHYLTLGSVTAGVLAANPEADRKYAFPALTEMTRMSIAGGDGQEVVLDEALPQPLRVAVANGEWPVKGARVRFVIEAGGGSVSPANGGLTGSDGIAQCVWTPGNAVDDEFRVKATLVDPDDATSDLVHPPVYFYANLINADQVAYEPACPASGENAVHSLLASDAAVGLELEPEGYYTVKDVLDALLCKLRAKHVPYDPTHVARWADISEEEGSDPPDTVQAAIDTLLENLQSEDVSYPLPSCSPNTLRDYLEPLIAHRAGDAASRYRVKALWDALLCHLDAAKVPYNPNQSAETIARWRDILEQPGAGDLAEPNTVQEAIDGLIQGLESTDVRYDVPACGTTAAPSVRLGLGLAPGTHKIDEVLDKLLCEFSATDLPINRGAELCDGLAADPSVRTVQDALNALCAMDRGGGCAVTVGRDGAYPTIEAALAALADELRISLCLLPGVHMFAASTVRKTSISIDGHGAATVLLKGRSTLQADDLSLDGIQFVATNSETAAGTGTGGLDLLAARTGKCVVEHCTFTRTYSGAESGRLPLVIVRDTGHLSWTNNRMSAAVQRSEIVDATLPDRRFIPAEALVAYDRLHDALALNPYEEFATLEARVQAAAEEISGLTVGTRATWSGQRPTDRINNLPTTVSRRLMADTAGVGGAGSGARGAAGVGGVADVDVLRAITTPPAATPAASLVSRDALRLPPAEVSPREGVTRFYADLFERVDGLSIAAVRDAILGLLGVIYSPDYALALAPQVSGWVSSNEISGYLALYHKDGGDKPTLPLSWGPAPASPRLGNKRAWQKASVPAVFRLAAGQLQLHGNAATAVHSMMPREILADIESVLSSGATPNMTVEAYESLTITDNVLREVGSSFVARSMNIGGNQLPSPDDDKSISAFAFGVSGICVGNQAFEPASAVFEQILNRAEYAANLLTISI